MRGPRQDSPAEEQVPIDIEIVDLRAVVTIDVGEDRAKPVDRCPRGAARLKKEDLCDVTGQSGEQPLGAEDTEELGKDGMDVAKPDRGMRRVLAIGAHLE